MMPPKPKADELLEQMWQEYVDSFDLENIPEHEFSPEFEKKMEQMIRRQRRMENRLPILKMARKVAVILVICCMIAFSGLMTVEAFRDRVIHFFTQVFSTHTEIEISTEGYEDAELVPLELGYLPEGMEEVDRQENENLIRSTYQNEIYFLDIEQSVVTDGILILDTEGASSQICSIEAKTVTVIEKDNCFQAVWNDSDNSLLLYSNLPWEEVEKIIENITIP